jgi:hypothetical protein
MDVSFQNSYLSKERPLFCFMVSLHLINELPALYQNRNGRKSRHRSGIHARFPSSLTLAASKETKIALTMSNIQLNLKATERWIQTPLGIQTHLKRAHAKSNTKLISFQVEFIWVYSYPRFNLARISFMWFHIVYIICTMSYTLHANQKLCWLRWCNTYLSLMH